MPTKKRLSLKGARTPELLERFCKEHPSKGDEDHFFRLLGAMVSPSKPIKPHDPVDSAPGS